MFMTPEEILAPCVLLLEQESYMSYIKKKIKTILLSAEPYTPFLRNQLQKILGRKIGENQSGTIKKIEQF